MVLLSDNNVITNDSPLKLKGLIIMKIKGLENYGLGAKFSLVFIFFENKVLLEHSHTYLFVTSLWLLLCYTSSVK